MTFDISDYDELQIYITDGWREWYIPKFRLTWVVSEPYITLYWTDTEKGTAGIRRSLELDYQDVVFGYASPSSAAEIALQLQIYMVSAFGGSSGTAWGTITGTLSAQTDLQSALDLKEDEANKTDTMAGNTASSVKYLSAKGVYDWAIATFQAILTAANFGDFIVALTGKTTPVDADTMVISDSAASDDAKKVTLTNFKAFLKTYFDTLYTGIGASVGGILGGTLPNPTFSNGTSVVPVVTLPINGSAAATLTNQAAAADFFLATNRNIFRYDLTGYTSIRIIGRVSVASASANTPRLKVMYDLVSGGFSTAIGNFAEIGTGGAEVSISLAATGVIDSGWVALLSTAKTDCYLTVCQIGGDAAADPSLGYVNVFIR